MTLCDIGPLVGLINASDKDHIRCQQTLQFLKFPLCTTWPCLTEVLYLLGQYSGFYAQDKIWQMVDAGIITLHMSSDAERNRMRTLMTKYQNVPMDLADASLVAAAEALIDRKAKF